MFDVTETTTNVSHQILQRESNCKVNGNPRSFATRLYRERLRVARNLYKTDLKGHFGCVNAIEFSHGGQFLASGGDDKRVLIWDIENSLAGSSIPRSLATEQSSNIFCLGFDSKNRKLISGGNDALAISHDFETGKLDNVFKHEEPVYGLSIDPQNDSIFATASENGVVLLFDQRTDPADPLVVASLSSSFHAVEFHPTMSHLMVTANSKRGAALYDIRKPKQPVIQYGNLGNLRSCMSVRFNRTGNLILGLRRRLTPILYSVNSPERICTFYHSNYYNSCTMKSCTFAGEDDELVISGSDDFNLYVWRLSDIDFEATEQWVETTQMVLYGHRSIVNQVRYNRQKCLLASSGVEKLVKIWSPFSQYNWSGSLVEEANCSDNPRELYSPYNLFTMALPENWHHLSHDYSSENTNEDPRMMAFFDSLIQQEIEGWDTNSSSSEASQDEERSITSVTRSSCESSTSSSSSSSSNSSDSSSSSSLSSSSSDSDSDNENNSSAVSKTKRTHRTKRQTATRKKVTKSNQRSNSKKTKKPKVNLNQIQKPANRIAYLISKKRNTLRRLAIKGATLDSRRSHKLVVVVNGRNNTRPTSSKRSSRRSTKDRQDHVSNPHNNVSSSSSNNNNNNEEPSTSKAAAAAMAASSGHHKVQITKSPMKTDSANGSSGEDSGNFAISSSSRSNPANNSQSSSNNANIPSTSTGITSNFRDAFLRLSRQIFMSDSEDDSDGNNDQQSGKNNETSRTEEGATNRKLNGANKKETNDGEDGLKNNSNNTRHETIRISKRPARNSQRPKTSAALNVINATETILPQPISPTNDYLQLNSNTDHRSGSCSGDSSSNDDIRQSPSTARSSKKRPCQDSQVMEQLSSNSRQANVTYDEHTLSSSSSSSSYSSRKLELQQSRLDAATSSFLSSPLKKRKISLNDYIHVRRSSNDLDELEENNNETNNNDIFTMEGNILNANSGQTTPQRPNLNSSNNLSIYLNSNNSYLFTPDSGVSLNNSSTTPSTIDHNDTSHAASTSHSSRLLSHRLSPCFEDDDNDDCNAVDVENEDEGVVVLNSRKSNMNKYQQKLARVRRNYRKQFVDDTESE